MGYAKSHLSDRRRNFTVEHTITIEIKKRTVIVYCVTARQMLGPIGLGLGLVLTTKELHEHTVFLSDTRVLVYCRPGSAHVLERSYECSLGFSSAFYYSVDVCEVYSQ